MTRLSLFHTDYCHLCEQALLLVVQVGHAGFELEQVDIVDDDELMELYSWHIPVLRREDTAAELRWPFEADHLKKFLS